MISLKKNLLKSIEAASVIKSFLRLALFSTFIFDIVACGVRHPDGETPHLKSLEKVEYPTSVREERSEFEFTAIGDIHILDDDPRIHLTLALNKAFSGDADDVSNWPKIEINGNLFSRADRDFEKPRGLLIPGDITEDGTLKQWEQFVRFTERMEYPVYEGYGNHDFEIMESVAEAEARRKSFSGLIATRNRFLGKESQRPETFHKQDENMGSYYWNWGDIRFFNLNLKPAGLPEAPCSDKTLQEHLLKDAADCPDVGLTNDEVNAGEQCREFMGYKTESGSCKWRFAHPNYSLQFLRSHLEHNTQVVIMSHYGPISGSKRFSREELMHFCEVLTEKQVRVIAWIVGHSHRSEYFEWSCNEYVVPVFTVGNAKMERKDPADKMVHFATFRISDRWLEAIDCSYEVSDGRARYSCPGIIKNRKFTDSKCCSSPKRNGAAIYDNINKVCDCYPERQYGGWAVRAPICPREEKPYKKGEINKHCLLP